MVLSSALVYSTCSPVSVWGTGKKSRSFFLEVASLILFSSDCKCSSESKHSKLRHSRVPIALHPFGVDLGAANEEVFKQTLLLFLSLCVDWLNAENLEHSAITYFTWLIVTHVSILASDISSRWVQRPSTTYRTFRYRWIRKAPKMQRFLFGKSFRIPKIPSRRFGESLEPLYIFGAMKLDQWAITLSSKDGCFQAHLLVVVAFLLAFLTKWLLKDLSVRSGLFPSRLWILSPKVCL